jgi:hypothetical protein
MDDITKEIARVPTEQCREWMGWGARIGEHHALEFVAHKCTEADAMLLKDMRDSGKYKEMGTAVRLKFAASQELPRNQ